jgi:hypothetical protein
LGFTKELRFVLLLFFIQFNLISDVSNFSGFLRFLQCSIKHVLRLINFLTGFTKIFLLPRIMAEWEMI